MFCTVKSKILLITSAVILIIAALSLSCALIPAYTPKYEYCVVLDAGHGGIDKGVVGKVSGVSEAEINLSVAQNIKSLLESQKIKVVLTRTDNSAERTKSKDMANRKAIIMNAEPDLVVSVHCNKFPDATRRGGQVFYNTFSENSSLADAIQTNLNALNAETAGRTFAALGGDYYILNCSPYPSALVECGFLSNPEDEALLISPEYRARIAHVIFSGILSFLTTNQT